jgi:hypothetical protein
VTDKQYISNANHPSGLNDPMIQLIKRGIPVKPSLNLADFKSPSTNQLIVEFCIFILSNTHRNFLNRKNACINCLNRYNVLIT